MSAPRIIVALDFAHADAALALAGRLSPQLCGLKIGKELFTSAGPALVETLVKRRYRVFLDLKFHDIPNTVAQACKAAAALGVWMLNVHAMGGRAMMAAAREALGVSSDRPRLLAVTVLTSMQAQDLADIGITSAATEEEVSRLARLAMTSGLDGVVCSALEAGRLRSECGAEFLLVTPGIRPAPEADDDQKRVATPRDAIAAGASYLVVGRPITRAADPLGALTSIQAQIDSVS